MPTLNFDSLYGKSEGIVFSPQELRSLYLYGIKFQDRNGQTLPDSTYKFFIQSAQAEVEKFLGIKLKKQIISESIDFYLDEFKQWGYIQTSYPVVKPYMATGFLGSVRQLDYPSAWLTARKTSDGETYFRRIFVVPSQSATVTNQGTSILYSGVLPYTSLTSFNSIPNYWNVQYCTGFDKIPKDILDVIGKIAAIEILNIAGDVILGIPGLAGYTLSIDGLSQSINTTKSSTKGAFGGRIDQYQKEIQDTLDKLRIYYKGIIISSM